MPSLEFFLFAESVSIDQFTNRLSLFNVIEEAQAEGFPAVLSRLVAVSSWNMRTDEVGQDFQVSLFVKQPGDQEAKRHDTNITAQGRRHRVVNHIGLLPIERAGDVEFEVRISGGGSAHHVVTIIPIQQGSDLDGVVLQLKKKTD